MSDADIQVRDWSFLVGGSPRTESARAFGDLAQNPPTRTPWDDKLSQALKGQPLFPVMGLQECRAEVELGVESLTNVSVCVEKRPQLSLGAVLPAKTFCR